MVGVSKEKKAQRRKHIGDTALRLFAERGFEAVTVNEIAEAAGVAKVTLFNYFPNKEALVLDGVEEDVAGVVGCRRRGQTPLGALREHYLLFAEHLEAEVDIPELMTRMKVIIASPTLTAGMQEIQYGQRAALAMVLSGRDTWQLPADDLTADLMAAQITATILLLQEAFFDRLAGGMSLREAGESLRPDVNRAFDLLERGHGT
ncbi:TetR family transcriptional regulator [Nonomuraea endophytica]|uniref:TetR family transcriptional regulator n=1 Tax=Nonomuraea endophytica TaxID=714136 RepID=UPI0037C8DD94